MQHLGSHYLALLGQTRIVARHGRWLPLWACVAILSGTLAPAAERALID
jgi:hypothetical protein